jgi:hypothetical protein
MKHKRFSGRTWCDDCFSAAGKCRIYKDQWVSCTKGNLLIYEQKISNMSLGRTAKLNTGAEIPLVGLGNVHIQ